MITFEAAGMMDRGLRRPTNEDAMFLDNGNGLFVVSDGMGGHNAGEIASRMVIECFLHALQEEASGGSGGNTEVSIPGLSEKALKITSWIQRANHLVREAAEKKPEYAGMGATVAAVWIEGHHLVAANMGDSPIYRFHRSRIETLSEMHNVASEYHGHDGDPQGAMAKRYGGLLTRAIGTDETAVPHVCETQVHPNDRIVLCSDGLSDLVEAKEIRDVAMKTLPSVACSQLIYLANERGGKDNISVVVIRMKPIALIWDGLWRTFFRQKSRRKAH